MFVLFWYCKKQSLIFSAPNISVTTPLLLLMRILSQKLRKKFDFEAMLTQGCETLCGRKQMCFDVIFSGPKGLLRREGFSMPETFQMTTKPTIVCRSYN